MDDELGPFAEDFNREVRSRADANDCELVEALTECMCEAMVEYGELDDFNLCSWLDKRIGARVDAYCFDDDYEVISLVVSIWKDWDGSNATAGRTTNSEIDQFAKRARSFLDRSRVGKLPSDRIDDGHPAYDLALVLAEAGDGLRQVRIIVISDGRAPLREGTVADVNGLTLSVVIWDIQRLYNRQKTGEREGIRIDFRDYGGAIPCVCQRSANGFYTTYLAFVSGEILADLYERHKTRLLEMNVRVFLSQRVQVNKGMRDTILNEPSMFAAYNNGITVYAENIETCEDEAGSLELRVVEDFQIVNGGQTTASLFHTRRSSKADLSAVAVQMKVMVIHEAAKPTGLPDSVRLSDQLVPLIGRYSNTQNRVQMSDLHANDPPHPELHSISLKLPAPDPTGGTRESYWFYEKSRGSWDERRRLDAKTASQRKHYDLKYPRGQRFDKGLFAKAWYSHHQKPHIVSLGPQKCFAEFNTYLLKEELKLAADAPGYWPEYFRRTVGLLVLWKRLEREVKAKIRQGLYRSHAQPLVAYTVALFSWTTDRKLDIQQLWKRQAAPDFLVAHLLDLCDVVHEHILDLPPSISIVQEWCKKENCWEQLQKRDVQKTPAKVSSLLATKKGGALPAKSAGEAAVEFCVSKGPGPWMALSSYLKQRDLMGAKQRSQAFNVGKALQQDRSPSARLAVPARQIWENAALMYGWSDD